MPGSKPLVVSGRVQKPLAKKLNPIWWFGNEDQQTVDQAPWFHPEWPEWERQFSWNVLRNPLMNFNAYVIGARDRNYTVRVISGNPNPAVIQRDDVGETGWQISMIDFGNGVKLPWFSYSGPLNFNFGWQPTGNFEIKLHP